MEVIAGTYDELILGYKVSRVEKEFKFELSFTDHSHLGCVKTVAVSRKGILASGSTDETIRLLNLRKRTELGSLTHHSGTITCLQFHRNSHLFSSSEDGTITVWKFFTWECLKTLKGHKDAVNYVSVHPSGKLALTVGKDKVLRAWNLITGRPAYTTSIKQEAHIVCWSPEGQYYAIVFNQKVDIYKTESAAVCSTVQTGYQRVNDLHFVTEEVVMFGGDGGKMFFHDTEDGTLLHTLDTGTNRIKGLHITTDEGCGENEYLLFTASSDGTIGVYQLIVEDKKQLSTKLLSSHSTKFRLTCLTVHNPQEKNLDSSKRLVKSVSVKTEKSRDSDVSETDDEDFVSGEEHKEDTDSDGQQSMSVSELVSKTVKKETTVPSDSEEESDIDNSEVIKDTSVKGKHKNVPSTVSDQLTLSVKKKKKLMKKLKQKKFDKISTEQKLEKIIQKKSDKKLKKKLEANKKLKESETEKWTDDKGMKINRKKLLLEKKRRKVKLKSKLQEKSFADNPKKRKGTQSQQLSKHKKMKRF